MSAESAAAAGGALWSGVLDRRPRRRVVRDGAWDGGARRPWPVEPGLPPGWRGGAGPRSPWGWPGPERPRSPEEDSGMRPGPSRSVRAYLAPGARGPRSSPATATATLPGRGASGATESSSAPPGQQAIVRDARALRPRQHPGAVAGDRHQHDEAAVDPEAIPLAAGPVDRRRRRGRRWHRLNHLAAGPAAPRGLALHLTAGAYTRRRQAGAQRHRRPLRRRLGSGRLNPWTSLAAIDLHVEGRRRGLPPLQVLRREQPLHVAGTCGGLKPSWLNAKRSSASAISWAVSNRASRRLRRARMTMASSSGGTSAPPTGAGSDRRRSRASWRARCRGGTAAGRSAPPRARRRARTRRPGGRPPRPTPARATCTRSSP